MKSLERRWRGDLLKIVMDASLSTTMNLLCSARSCGTDPLRMFLPQNWHAPYPASVLAEQMLEDHHVANLFY